jgi:hypothetical protein
VVELYDGCPIEVKRVEVKLNLPPQSGRILVPLRAADEKIEHRLLTSALELTKEGVEALMRFPRAPRPRCEVSPNSVEISSAGSWLCISPERALLFTIGDVPMELWVAPLWMPLSRDEFLLERFENVRRYAKLASGLLTQSRLQWR